MVEQNRKIVINAKDETYTFRVIIHKAESPNEQKIEPGFYQEFAGGIHQGTHFEMELMESPVWGRFNPEIPAHIHQNPESKKHFVCFTGNIPSLEAALAVLRIWCVGVVYAMTHNEDFGPLVQQHGPDFSKVMRDNYGITIKQEVAE